MEVDLYQRRGLRGLGDDASPAPTSGMDLSTILAGQSPYVTLGLGAVGLWLLSSLFSGGKKAYRTVARPLKKRAKRKRSLEEAKDRYERERKRIEEGKSAKSGGFF